MRTRSWLKVHHQVIIPQAATVKKYWRLKGNSAFQIQEDNNRLTVAPNSEVESLQSLLEVVFLTIDLGEFKLIRVSWSFSSAWFSPRKGINYSLGLELKEICRFIMLFLYQIALRGNFLSAWKIIIECLAMLNTSLKKKISASLSKSATWSLLIIRVFFKS